MIKDHKRRDRLLAGQAAAILLMQLVAWLVIFYVGFSLLLWPFIPRGITTRSRPAGPALFGSARNGSLGPPSGRSLDLAALTGTRHGHAADRLPAYPLLGVQPARDRGGAAERPGRRPVLGPGAAGPHPLRAGLGHVDRSTPCPTCTRSGSAGPRTSAESHTTYLPLVRFRSPKPLSSWVTAPAGGPRLGRAVPRPVPEGARRSSRPGCACAAGSCASATWPGRWASRSRPSPTRRAGISVTYEEFLDAVARMQKVDFPIEREPEDAWPDFVGWRVNYEQAAYAVAYALDVVPALWSGPRPHPRPRSRRSGRPRASRPSSRAMKPAEERSWPGSGPSWTGSSATTTSPS